MGVSTNGQICFGIPFEEDAEFPWDFDEPGDGEGIEDWWTYHVCGFTHSKECYDEAGEQLPGVTEADVQAYFKERRDFDAKHPMPVEMVNYCSGDYPMYIIAVPGSVKTNRRGDAVEFDPSSLAVTTEEEKALMDFCKEHKIELPCLPKWLLSSYWG